MDKMDANPLLLAQIAELSKRVAKLEAENIVAKTVFETLISDLCARGVIANEFIDFLHQQVKEREMDFEQRRGPERPDWEWKALGAAVPLLRRWFAGVFAGRKNR